MDNKVNKSVTIRLFCHSEPIFGQKTPVSFIACVETFVPNISVIMRLHYSHPCVLRLPKRPYRCGLIWHVPLQQSQWPTRSLTVTLSAQVTCTRSHQSIPPIAGINIYKLIYLVLASIQPWQFTNTHTDTHHWTGMYNLWQTCITEADSSGLNFFL